MAPWKAYWIMRGVEAYLIRTHDSDATELVSQIINQFEYEMVNATRAGLYRRGVPGESQTGGGDDEQDR